MMVLSGFKEMDTMQLPIVNNHTDICFKAKESYREGNIGFPYFMASLCPDCYEDVHHVVNRVISVTKTMESLDDMIVTIYGSGK